MNNVSASAITTSQDADLVNMAAGEISELAESLSTIVGQFRF